ncbi:MAG: Clp protease N-terminal domain-containing protein [Eubacterium ramulus]
MREIAYEYGNQEIEQEHLLVALMRQEDSLIPMLIEKMEINKQHFMNDAEDHLAKRVKVSGGQVYVGQRLNKVLMSAEDEAKQMGDEYVSVEHLFLSINVTRTQRSSKKSSVSMESQETDSFRYYPPSVATRES